jgi:hypothetical protein
MEPTKVILPSEAADCALWQTGSCQCDLATTVDHGFPRIYCVATQGWGQPYLPPLCSRRGIQRQPTRCDILKIENEARGQIEFRFLSSTWVQPTADTIYPPMAKSSKKLKCCTGNPRISLWSYSWIRLRDDSGCLLDPAAKLL